MTAPQYLYIHGFNSSPQSYKAQQLLQWFSGQELAQRYQIPALSFEPALAIEQLCQRVKAGTGPLVLLGSSLGGFYATWLTEQLQHQRPIRSVLINPSIRPFDLLSVWLGENENIYSHERYLLTRDHLQQLRDLHCPELADPSRYLLLTQTGDEVLDYRQGVEKYADSQQWVIEGGDHGFQNFEACWPRMFEFAGDGEQASRARDYLAQRR
jgi:predicted esterase YcpF (UPF0227 family)